MPVIGAGQNQKWPISGRIGHITPPVKGFAKAERGTKSEVAHKWADWLGHPCRLGGSPTPHCWGEPGDKLVVGRKWVDWPRNPCHMVFRQGRAWDDIGSGPQVGGLAMSPLLSGRSPTLHSGGTKSKVAHKWADWLFHACRFWGAQRLGAGDKISSGPQVGGWAT